MRSTSLRPLRRDATRMHSAPLRLSSLGTPAFALDLVLPLGATASEPSRVDVSMVPGARVVLAHAWRATDSAIEAVCVVAPTSHWLPGLEATVLAGAIARVRVAGSLDAMIRGPIEGAGTPFRQVFTGSAHGVSARGVSVLGFVGEEREAVLCTAACVATVEGACSLDFEGASLVAELRAPPEPGPWLRAATAAAEHMRVTAAGAVLLTAAFAALLLARRPRPRFG